MNRILSLPRKAISILFATALIFIGGREAVADDRPLVLMLADRSNESAFQRVTQAMVAQFTDSDIRFDVHWLAELPARLPDQERLAAEVADRNGAMVVFWMDLEAKKRAYFFLTTANNEQIFMRRLEGMGEEGMPDALALMGKTAVDAVLGGGIIGIAPPALKEEEDTTPVAPLDEAEKPRRKTLFFMDASYALNILSGDDVQHGACFSTSMSYAGWFRIFLGYTFYQTLEDRNVYAKLYLKRHPIHLGTAARYRIGRWSLEGLVSVVFDPTTRETIPYRNDVELDEPYTRLDISLLPALRAEVAIMGSVSLFVTAGAEIHLTKRDFYLENGPENDTDFFKDLMRVQPYLQIGVRVDVP